MKHALSVDIGGTSTRLAIVTESGTIVTKQSFATDAKHPHLTLVKIQVFVQSFDQDLVGVGISCPGPLDLKRGIVLTPPNLEGWHHFHLKKEAEKILNLPVIVENDANLACYAESVVGAGKDFKSVQYLTISTGVGGGLVINGDIYRGANGFAEEIANGILWKNGPQMGTLKSGSLESICSGTALTTRAIREGLIVTHAGDVFDLASKGNQIAAQIIDDMYEYLSNMIGIIIGILDPHVIVLGGGVANKTSNFIPEIESRVLNKVYAIQQSNLNIVESILGDDNGLIGGALYAFNQFGGLNNEHC